MKNSDIALKLYKEGKSDPCIARAIGLTPVNVCGWRAVNGLVANSASVKATKYKVTLIESGEVVAQGTARRCSELLKLNDGYFRQLASKGGNSKYIVEENRG